MNAIMLPCGDGKVSYIDIKDIAGAAVQILLEPEIHYNKRYILTGNTAVGYKDIADIISEQTGYSISYTDIPEAKAFEMMQKIGLSENLIKAKMFSFKLEKEDKRSYISQDVKTITGKDPLSYRDFVKRNIEQFQN